MGERDCVSPDDSLAEFSSEAGNTSTVTPPAAADTPSSDSLPAVLQPYRPVLEGPFQPSIARRRRVARWNIPYAAAVATAFVCGLLVESVFHAVVRTVPDRASDRGNNVARLVRTTGSSNAVPAAGASASPAISAPASTGARRAPGSAGFRGSLVVTSAPADADVAMNGQWIGRTPLTIRNLRVGSRAIQVTKAGYQRWGSVVQIVTDTRATVRARLEPHAVQTDVVITAASAP